MPLAYKTTKQILIDYGFVLDRQSGSHQIWKRWQAQVVIPFKKEYALGTGRSILKRIASLSQTDLSQLVQSYNIKF